MVEAGFNLARLRRAAASERSVIDTETLAIRLSGISPESAPRAFVEYVRWVRAERLSGGKVYAADAYEGVGPYGGRRQRLGRVYRYGLSLVI